MRPAYSGKQLSPAWQKFLTIWRRHGTSFKVAKAVRDGDFQTAERLIRGGKAGLARREKLMGKRFGEGIYLSETLENALSYAPLEHGYKFVILCRAVCGELHFTQSVGEGNATEMAKAAGKDSVLAHLDGEDSREFVILDEQQAYPEYCLVLKNEDPDSSG